MKSYTDEELLAGWRKLEATGIPLEPPECRVGIGSRYSSGKLLIEDEGGNPLNMILAINKFCWGYILSPFVLCDFSGKTIILNWELELPWVDPLFEWLPDPRDKVPREAQYIFPGKSPVVYSRTLVINHRMGIAMKRGDVLRGLLLGIGYERPPVRFRTGDRILAKLTFADQWSRCHSAPFEMLLDRTGELRNPASQKRESSFQSQPRVSSGRVLEPAG